MKFYHAAALALVGWYLIVPPLTSEKVLPNAPFSQWEQVKTFDTANACKKDMRFLASIFDSEAVKHAAAETGQAADLAVGKKRLDAAICISADDPRLKGN